MTSASIARLPTAEFAFFRNGCCVRSVRICAQRSTEAIRQKAGRGELRIPLPVGFFCWSPAGKIEKDADERVRQAIELVFRKMTDLVSARQVLIWLRHENVCIPFSAREGELQTIWKLPLYQNIRAILTNPVHAGTYAFGKTETRTAVIDGRARRSSGHHKPRSEWIVLIRDHHPGYIAWDEYERNQAMIAANTYGHSGAEPKSGRGGRALLSGLLRCWRCGRMLYVAYSGPKGGLRFA